jgi:hypothetical protein
VNASPSAVSKREMPWLVPLFFCLALVGLITGVFVASVRNAQALRRDLDDRGDAAQTCLERQANALADELLARELQKELSSVVK